MSSEAVNLALEMADDALVVAEEAVKRAEELESAPIPETVEIVKVASSRYREVAERLIKSGSFSDKTEDELTKDLEEGGIPFLLTTLEKLAASAVFSAGDDFFSEGGQLVERVSDEKPQSKSGERVSTDIWQDACEEAGLMSSG